MTFSPSTLNLFAELLGQVSLPVQHPALVELAQQVFTAREELQAALDAAQPQPIDVQLRSPQPHSH